MKLSLKFLGSKNEDDRGTQIMTAKVPISIFNHPFISAIKSSTTTTTHSSSEFSFSLSTNFPSAPSFKLSYSPTSPSSLPFSLSLKSGLGIFGSPRNSPLLFSVNFSLSPSSYNPVPTFFLHFKPSFGHFSLNKTVFSDPNTQHPPHSPTVSLDNNAEIGKSFVTDDASSSVWQELKLDPCDSRDHTHVGNSDYGGIGFVNKSEKFGLSPGVAVMARTVMPVTKGLMLSFRWGVNFPGNLGLKMPCLTVNKIGLERVAEEVKQNKQSSDTSDTDLQLLKGMCFCMTRDLENVEKENSEIKRVLDEMKMGVSTRNHREGRKLSPHSGESSSKSESWRSNKSGREENEQREPNKSQILVSDVESELQKAIKAASS